MKKFRDLIEGNTITVDMGYGTKSNFGDSERLYNALGDANIKFDSKLDLPNDSVTLTFKKSSDKNKAEKIIFESDMFWIVTDKKSQEILRTRSAQEVVDLFDSRKKEIQKYTENEKVLFSMT